MGGCIKFLLLCRGEGESPPSGELGIGMELYGVVPCLTRGEVGKVFVAFQDSLSGQVGLLSLSLLCQSLQRG